MCVLNTSEKKKVFIIFQNNCTIILSELLLLYGLVLYIIQRRFYLVNIRIKFNKK